MQDSHYLYELKTSVGFCGSSDYKDYKLSESIGFKVIDPPMPTMITVFGVINHIFILKDANSDEDEFRTKYSGGKHVFVMKNNMICEFVCESYSLIDEDLSVWGVKEVGKSFFTEETLPIHECDCYLLKD
jgi:hypothetical protein